MREFSFRAWDEQAKFMYDPFRMSEFSRIALSAFRSSHDLKIMQYTGLKDKNGREIYEGDIVKQTGSYSERIFVVEWKRAGFELPEKEIYDDGRAHEDWHLDYEIIGNIYETPELINGKASV